MDIIRVLEFFRSKYFELIGLLAQNILFLTLVRKEINFQDFYFNNGIIIENLEKYVSMFIVLALINLIWFVVSFKKPNKKISKNSIAFIINAENYQDYIYIKRLFTRRIKNTIEKNKENDLQVLFINYYPSKLFYKKSVKNQKKYILKNMYNIVFYCELNSGGIAGIPSVELKSEIGVITAFLNVHNQNELLKELDNLIEKYLLKINNDLIEGSELSCEIVIVLEYIVVIASLLSGNPSYSFESILDLQVKLGEFSQDRKSVNYIRKRINYTLGLIHFNCTINAYRKYLNDSTIDLSQFLFHIEMLSQFEEHKYDYFLTKSAFVMLEDRDSIEARKLILNAKNTKHVGDVWKISIAFLDCYEGELLNSYINYKEALRVDYEDFIGIELYIQRIYELDKSKYQFDFALALINELVKDDRSLAKEYYESFIRNAELNNEYLEIVDIVKKRLLKLESRTSFNTPFPSLR